MSAPGYESHLPNEMWPRLWGAAELVYVVVLVENTCGRLQPYYKLNISRTSTKRKECYFHPDSILYRFIPTAALHLQSSHEMAVNDLWWWV